MKSMVRKLFKRVKVIQEIETENGLIKNRLNPYNPLSYLCFITGIVIGFLAFGFLGFWDEVVDSNPFKWHYGNIPVDVYEKYYNI